MNRSISVRYRRMAILSIIMAMSLSVTARERGMANLQVVYIEKGTISAGVSFGFDSWTAEGDKGYDLLGIIQGLYGYVQQGDITASGAWFMHDNLSIGLRIGYTDTRVSVDSTEFAGIELPDRNIMRQTISGAFTCRGYMPLFDGRILALFFEGRLSGSTGYVKSYKLTGRGKEGSYSDLWSVSAGIYPGVSVFATDKISFEVSLPLFEGGLRWQKQNATESGDGTLMHSFVNFKPGLIGLRMGLIYHF